ncbi:protein of unknown function [Thauera humireducens]|nr:protein of unknown function [Thauera humireducens]
MRQRGAEEVERNSVVIIVARQDLLKTSGYSRCPNKSGQLEKKVFVWCCRLGWVRKFGAHREWLSQHAFLNGDRCVFLGKTKDPRVSGLPGLPEVRTFRAPDLPAIRCRREAEDNPLCSSQRRPPWSAFSSTPSSPASRTAS